MTHELLPQQYRHAWMTREMDDFRAQVKRYITRELSPNLDTWRRQGFIPREVWKPFAQMGFLLPEFGEEWGGGGGTLAHQLVVQDEMALQEVPENIGVHSIVSHYILDYGTPEQKARWVPGLVSGDFFASIALTEPGCGSDLKSLRTRAQREGDTYVINGAKMFITNAFSGNFMVVAARTGEAGSGGVSLLVVENTHDQPGFRIGRRLEKLGQHASDTCEVFFDNLRVPAHNLLGTVEGQGFRQVMSQLAYERLLLAVPAAAAIELAVSLTVDYTRQRPAFGQQLSDFQNTRFKLAECATIAHVVRGLVNDCIQRLLDGTLDDEAAYMAKWWCTEQQCKVVDDCLQLFGGYGYMSEYPIARLYADARVQRIYGGTTEIMKDLIARRLFA